MGGVYSTHSGDEKCIKIVVGKSEGKRSLRRPWRSRWEDNIKMNLKEVRMQVVDWIHVAQVEDRWRTLVNTVMNLRVP
jgi:hypothetical protein